jgi:putative sigma-54 modulation protein
MATKVEIQGRNIGLTDRVRKHIEQRAGKLDHYLPVIEEAYVELTQHKSARSINDRNVAQITVRGKGLILRTEERSDEILTAFDTALDKLQHQIERYKGKHYHGRGDGQTADELIDDVISKDDTDRLPPVIARHKHFQVLPMNELEAVEQMNLLGHDNFFIFYNAVTNKINVLYRRRDNSYGLIEVERG